MEEIVEIQPVVISISVVSHGQMGLIVQLMHQIEQHCCGQSIELILTLNVEEALPFDPEAFSFPIRILENTIPKGFGANHNQAFAVARGNYFCIVNPDIRFDDCPLPVLKACLDAEQVGVVAPLVVGSTGRIEDSARFFPTPLKIIRKIFVRQWASDYVLLDSPVRVDWLGGMFMMFTKVVFERLKGFDERYFLYYEDVDICARLSLLGLPVMVCPQARVTHDAQHSSHRNLKYLRWHLRSMLRFFTSPVFRQLKRLGRL